MHDLNLNLFYKTTFTIETTDQTKSALGQLINDIRCWLQGKYPSSIPDDAETWKGFWNGVHITISAPDTEITLDSAAYWNKEATSNWACTISEERKPRIGFAPRKWITEIGLSWDENHVGVFSLVLSYGDRPGFLGRCEEAPLETIPGIISILLNDHLLRCSLDGLPLAEGAILLAGGDFDTFWETVSNPLRETPVVFISPRLHSKGDLLAVDPTRIASLLGPSGHVYYTCSETFCQEMRQHIPNQEFRCENGAVRVYASMPRIDETGDSRRHRFFTYNDICEMGEEAFGQMLRRALAQDVFFYEHMVRTSTVRSKVGYFVMRKRADKAEAYADERVNSAEESALNLVEESDRRRQESDRTAEDLLVKNDLLEQKLHDLQCKADSLAYALESKGAGVGNEIALAAWPLGYKQIVNLFLAAYPERIDLTQNAWKSLDSCSTSPEVLWNALYDLCTILYDALANGAGSGDIARYFNDKSQFEYARGEGMMTRKDSKLMADYEDEYAGKPIMAEQHIGKGSRESDSNFIRVYFAFDNEGQRIILSSIGKHKKNYTTQSIH